MVVEDISFCLKSDTSSPLARIGGMIGIFLLLKNLFMIVQYVFGTLFGLSNFAFISAIYLFFDSLISEVHPCD